MADQNAGDATASDSPHSALIRLSLIGGTLAAVNNIVATLALGLFQGFIVSFTTPFAFCFGRLLHPRAPAATLIYLPVVIVSMFTINFGPPGHHKICFLLSAILYDAVLYAVRVRSQPGGKIALWKFLLANVAYPVGLIAAAILAMSIVTVEIPVIARGWHLAAGFAGFFVVVGAIASYVCHKVYYRWIASSEE